MSRSLKKNLISLAAVSARIGPMHRIGFDAFGEFLADGAGRGIGRIGGAHHFAVLGDGVLAFQHLHHHRARGHELDQAAEKGPLAMHTVESLGLGGGQAHAAAGDHPQARILEFGDDLAGQVPARRVRLDDRKGALDGHEELQKG